MGLELSLSNSKPELHVVTSPNKDIFHGHSGFWVELSHGADLGYSVFKIL